MTSSAACLAGWVRMAAVSLAYIQPVNKTIMVVRTLLQMQRSLQYGTKEALEALAKSRADLKERRQLKNEITPEGQVMFLASIMAVQLADACNKKGAKIPIDIRLNGDVRFIGHRRAQGIFHNPRTLSTPEQRVLSTYRIGLSYLDTLTRYVSHLRRDENRDARALDNYAESLFKTVFSKALDEEAKKIFTKHNVSIKPLLPLDYDRMSLEYLTSLTFSRERSKPSQFKKPLPGTRLVFAKIDREVGVNQELLDKLIQARIIHPAVRKISYINQARKGRSLKPITRSELDDVFLIPLRWAGKTSHEIDDTLGIFRRDSGVWGRSDYIQNADHAVLAKGIGVTPIGALQQESTEMPETLGGQPGATQRQQFSLFHRNVGNNIVEQDFRGGMTQQSVKSTSQWIHLIREEYRKALEEKDPVALFAKKEGIVNLPIPEHIVSFKPFETLVALNGQKRIRDPGFENIEQYRDDWRVWFYRSPHPHRMDEISQPTRPMSIASILAPHGITIRKGKLIRSGQEISSEKATEDVARRHTVSLAILVHLLSHRLKGTFGNKYGNVLTSLNTGPYAFFDFDTVEQQTNPKEWQRAYQDDLLHAKHTIRQTAKYVGLKLGASRFPVSENLGLFGRLVRRGRVYAQKRGLLTA